MKKLILPIAIFLAFASCKKYDNSNPMKKCGINEVLNEKDSCECDDFSIRGISGECLKVWSLVQKHNPQAYHHYRVIKSECNKFPFADSFFLRLYTYESILTPGGTYMPGPSIVVPRNELGNQEKFSVDLYMSHNGSRGGGAGYRRIYKNESGSYYEHQFPIDLRPNPIHPLYPRPDDSLQYFNLTLKFSPNADTITGYFGRVKPVESPSYRYGMRFTDSCKLTFVIVE